MCRLHHPYGRMLRRTKKALDESEKEERKSLLKAKHTENEDHGIWSHHFKANRWGKWQIVFWGAPKSADGDCSMKLKKSLLLPTLTLCDRMDYSPPGCSAHGILQARILEWVAITFSRGSSRPRDQTQVSRIGGRHFNL